MRFIGLDLTDPYANSPRPVDVAIVDLGGRCAFESLPGTASWPAALGVAPNSDDFLILDGPLGLASIGQRMRGCEQRLGTPGKTPAVLPTAGSGPFAGYVRGSVELAVRLVGAGWTLVSDGVPLLDARLLEAYPGGSWTPLAGARLPHKTTAAGVRARADLLRRQELTFATEPQTHDQVDAALCAWLGWTLHRNPGRIDPVGTPSFMDAGTPREGVILQVAGAAPGAARGTGPAQGTRPSLSQAVSLPAGVQADWVYFATPARADRWETANLALDPGLICRPAHNQKGALIANVGHVRPGDVVLLVYSQAGTHEAIGTFVVRAPDRPVAGAPAIGEVTDPGLQARLAASDYPIDATTECHTAFFVEPSWTPAPGGPVAVGRPAGNNALWRV